MKNQKTTKTIHTRKNRKIRKIRPSEKTFVLTKTHSPIANKNICLPRKKTFILEILAPTKSSQLAKEKGHTQSEGGPGPEGQTKTFIIQNTGLWGPFQYEEYFSESQPPCQHRKVELSSACKIL